MKKLNSTLFENFKKNEIDNTSFIVGGLTSSKDDCNTSSNDDDCGSKWKKDSTDKSDTTRSDDGCNEAAALLSF